MIVLSLSLGGMLGAVCRYVLSLRIKGLKGTLLINWFGSLLMGISLSFALQTTEWNHLWLIGFLGAFTTFSTFSVQVIECWFTDKRKSAMLYALLTLVGGYLFVSLGWWVSR